MTESFRERWDLPPSGEVESLLFALQAALGSGVVFNYLGYKKGEKRKAEAELSANPHKRSSHGEDLLF